MSNKSLKEYAVVARLWAADYSNAIKNDGVAHTFSGGYTTEEKLYNDVEHQLNTLIASGAVVADISVADAMSIIKGEKTVFDLS